MRGLQIPFAGDTAEPGTDHGFGGKGGKGVRALLLVTGPNQ